MIDNRTLHDELSDMEKNHFGQQFFKELVDEHQDIIHSLNHDPRDYQFNAIGRFIYYIEQYLNKQQPYHLLFNMATGAGKTLIMAATMLYLYKQGYRNFIFFTHLSNIIGKTKDNFLNSQSSKYLFAPNINIAGQRVSINEVNNFGAATDKDINIMFITIQKLGSLWQDSKENSLSPEDLDDKKIVLLGDEAHHFSAGTKKLNKDQQKENKTWEHTILGNSAENMDNLKPGLLHVNPLNENILLEFTATIAWDDPKISDKYKDKIICRYDFTKFRRDKYSKEVKLMKIQAPYFDRVLAAVILSQYRLKIAQRYKISPRPIKPVILFKSKQVKEPEDKSKTKGPNPTVVVSKVFKKEFHHRINNLKVSDLERIKNLVLSNENSDSDGSKILSKSFEFFTENNISLSNLVKEIQQDFAFENCSIVDTENDNKDDPIKKELLLNSLEDENNNIRAVFAVEKLNEGWDVLNLFDIVRLYDSRSVVDGRPGRTTNQEAQLIGRGARYCPFTTDDHHDEYQRKFDDKPDNPLAALETLHYHCTNNSRYINELNRAMIEQGVKELEQERYTIKPKDDIPDIPSSIGGENSKGTKWKDASIFLNRQKPRPKAQTKLAIEEAILDAETADMTLKSISISMKEEALARNSEDNSTNGSATNESNNPVTFLVKDLGDNVLRQAVEYDPRANLANLKEKFHNADSMSSFVKLIKDNIDNIKVMTHKKDVKELTQDEKLDLAKEILEKIFQNLFRHKSTHIGSTEFEPHSLGEKFGEPKQRNFDPKKNERRKIYNQDVVDRLVANEWFAQTEFKNATDQEIAFLQFIDNEYVNIKKKYEYFLLFRNDGHFKIYNFANEDKAHEGEATAPDFVLFFKQKGSKRHITHQLFVEAKGPQFFDKSFNSFKMGNQDWKAEFLESIVKKAKIKDKDKSINLLGAPFFHRKIGSGGSRIPYDKFAKYFENNIISTDKRRDTK